MNKKNGYIYKRKDGLYIGSIQRNGVRKSYSSRNKKEVQKMLDEYAKQREFIKDNHIIFSEYVRNYLFTYKFNTIKKSSFDRLEQILNCQIVGSSIDIQLCKLNDKLIQMYINDLVSLGYSHSVVSKTYELVKQILVFAYKKRDVSIDMASLIVKPTSAAFPPAKKIDVYSAEEQWKITDYIMQHYDDEKENKSFLRIAPAYVIMFQTGLRMGEMLALELDNVDLINNKIHVENTVSLIVDRTEQHKTKKIHIVQPCKTRNSDRWIPLNKKALEALQELQRRNMEHGYVSKYLVSNKCDGFIQPNSFQKKFKKICERVCVEYKGVHNIRHTFATNLISKGVNPKTVSEILGHSNVVFTLNRYVHPEDDEKINALNLL